MTVEICSQSPNTNKIVQYRVFFESYGTKEVREPLKSWVRESSAVGLLGHSHSRMFLYAQGNGWAVVEDG